MPRQNAGSIPHVDLPALASWGPVPALEELEQTLEPQAQASNSDDVVEVEESGESEVPVSPSECSEDSENRIGKRRKIQ